MNRQQIESAGTHPSAPDPVSDTTEAEHIGPNDADGAAPTPVDQEALPPTIFAPIQGATSVAAASKPGAEITAPNSDDDTRLAAVDPPTTNPSPQDLNDLNAFEHYINRELSQLKFVERVLAQARDHSVPLLERFRFLTICSQLLDEFFEISLIFQENLDVFM